MMLNLTYAQALCLAQEHELENDPNVFLFGPDVGDHKCTFNTTKGLRDRFGDKRIFSTPLSEDALMGVASGAAIAGLRPVLIFIRADFLLLSLSQLARAGCVRYLSGGAISCPVTIRAVIGKSWGNGPEHTKFVYPMLKYVPGVKVVVPSTPQEAYSLSRAAIRANDPVAVFEPRWLFSQRDDVDTELKMELDKHKHLWCEDPPTPTTQPLEDLYYIKKFGVNLRDETFRGPF